MAPQFGTDYAPFDADAAQLRDFIAPRVAQLAAFDSEVADLLRKVDHIHRERQALVDEIKPCMALLSPIRRMPEEVLREIFLACLPHDRNCVMSRREAPVLLGQVCSLWRNIAFSTPALWTKLHIVEPGSMSVGKLVSPTRGGVILLDNLAVAFETPNPPRHTISLLVARRIRGLNEWLSRSGVLPLSISFRGSQERRDALDNIPNLPTELFMRAICAYSRRWQDLHLRFLQTMAFSIALSHLEAEDVPLLRNLSLTQGGSSTFLPEIPWLAFRLFAAPSLRRLSYSGHGHFLGDLLVAWSQLLYLRVDYQSAPRHGLQVPKTEKLLQVIQRCTFLQTLVLNIDDDPRTSDAQFGGINGSGVELPSLRSFTLHVLHSCSRVPMLLGAMRIPKLQELSMVFDDPGLSQLLDLASGIIQLVESATELQSFEFSSYGFAPAAVVRILEALPSTLRHLSVIESTRPCWMREGDPGTGMGGVLDQPLTDAVLEALVPKPGSPAEPYACPRLETLSLRNCLVLSDRAILALVCARTQSVAPLRKFEISFHRNAELDSELEAELEASAERGPGLQFVVDYSPSVELSPLLSPWIDTDSM
ncbi:F-box domain-containing protein [Mycena chlorophos]|uniref:F-box domain-containing protein n=1 Tax=Mycena chlorophos TaxID=658473 RepID=A0A8H6SF57_MYCCL|nr:F-box domain-containing protein [Mycena chlorophos]